MFIAINVAREGGEGKEEAEVVEDNAKLDIAWEACRWVHLFLIGSEV